jgi:hypothetical protein
MRRPTFAVGVLIYNPYDDEYHLERIMSCVRSLIAAAQAARQVSVSLLLVPNMSEPLGQNIPGTGPETLKRLNDLASSAQASVKIEPHSYRDSMNVKGYNFILKRLFADESNDFISVFADDYIVPRDWFDVAFDELSKHTKADFLIPATSFVAQANLLVPLTIKKHWQLNTEGEVVFGVTTGVTFEDVEEIARSCRSYPTIRFMPPPSFETAVFRRAFLEKHGFLHEDYYSLFYNTEYFDRALASGFTGVTSRRAFVFHHGKGATKAVFKQGDEKFSKSPAERYLLNDIEIYNRRNNRDIKPWWTSGSPVRVGKPSNMKIRLLMKKYELMSWLTQYPQAFRLAKRAYRALTGQGA